MIFGRSNEEEDASQDASQDAPATTGEGGPDASGRALPGPGATPWADVLTDRLAPDAGDAGTLHVLIEIPKGSRNKYEYDHELGVFTFDRMLFSAVHYPADYGAIPGTLARDGDALDALVLVWEATFPGCVIEARPVGVFKMEDEKGPDEKVLCVPVGDPQWNHIKALDQVPPHLLKEIAHFFTVYKDLEEKKVDIQGWGDAKEARHFVKDARTRFLDQAREKGT